MKQDLHPKMLEGVCSFNKLSEEQIFLKAFSPPEYETQSASYQGNGLMIIMILLQVLILLSDRTLSLNWKHRL